MRSQVLDARLDETFRDWYPDKPPENRASGASTFLGL
jgi:hypothetical protein